MAKNGIRHMTRDEWIALGRKLYGEDMRKWKFRCVQCGNVQSHESVTERNPEIRNTSNWIFFSCEGRKTEGVGCDWTLGGLFKIHRLEVFDDQKSENPHPVPCFEFADDPDAVQPRGWLAHNPK